MVVLEFWRLIHGCVGILEVDILEVDTWLCWYFGGYLDGILEVKYTWYPEDGFVGILGVKTWLCWYS